MQELEEARDTLMKQISLQKALGDQEETVELSEQGPPGPLFARQISVDPVELDDGEWRVR